MRPHSLFPLFASVTSLPGVGKAYGKLLQKLVGEHVADILWHLPISLVDRSYSPKLIQAEAGRLATLTVKVIKIEAPPRPRLPVRISTTDGTAILQIGYFHAKAEWLAQQYKLGQEVVVSGLLERYGQDWQMLHPDYVVQPTQIAQLPRLEAVYPLTAGLSAKMLQKLIEAALRTAPELPEWLDPAFIQKNNWPNWRRAIQQAHAPKNPTDLEPSHPARQRLAYDELLANQLALALVRREQQSIIGQKLIGDGRLRQALLAALPFKLTVAQEQALQEVFADIAAPTRMLRLLQGDVGSGKTIVALLAMLLAVEAKQQAALMAPTEILARQHYETMQPLLAKIGLNIGLLLGGAKASKERKTTLAALANGELRLVVGTHALFQEEVQFQSLGLAVIDEQHRFGVHQRLTLANKGAAADMLVMTATPIPRTLALTVYGDMEVSRLAEKPPGRQPIDTRIIDAERLPELMAGLQRKITEGAQIYWVCPLIDESEKIDLAAASERYADLQKILGEAQVGLVHGRMKAAEKEAVMQAFSSGVLKVLVATTVIEVGVNVPNATIMVIEHAERFGLAQLHQLRGRVGRGDKKSSCVLLYHAPLGETAKKRLQLLRDSEDGFYLAEEDLRLRGAGEVLGTKQSGLPEFRLASLEHHHALLITARDDAKLIISRDPELLTERGHALRHLLYLFEREMAARYLRSG